MNIKLQIPVTIGGYTRQRDAWEEYEQEYEVEIMDSTHIKLRGSGTIGRTIGFDLDELNLAVEVWKKLNHEVA